MSVSVPHAAFPAAFQTNPDGTISLAVNEQGSIDDLLAGARGVVACPVGAWIDVPAFGINTGVFGATPVDAASVGRAISRWEPHAATASTEYPDMTSDVIRHVQIEVSAA